MLWKYVPIFKKIFKKYYDILFIKKGSKILKFFISQLYTFIFINLKKYINVYFEIILSTNGNFLIYSQLWTFIILFIKN